MNPLELKDDLKNIVLSPKGIYAAQKFHQIRLSTEIKTIKGVSLKKDITGKPGFRTSWSQQIGTTGDDIGFAATVDFEGNIYFRQEGKGMLLGTYEPKSTPWKVEGTPMDFGHELLEPKLENIQDRLAIGFKRMPALEKAGIKTLLMVLLLLAQMEAL